MLIIGGMNDPRVAFFEPLKFVAKMRHEKRKALKQLRLENHDKEDPDKEARMLLLKIQDAGHGGSSGQYSYLEDLASEYAFLITSLEASSRTFPYQSNNSAMESFLFAMKKPNISSESWELDTSGGKGIRLSNQNLRKTLRQHKEEDEKEYRTKTKKGDRGQNRLFQWLNNFGF